MFTSSGLFGKSLGKTNAHTKPSFFSSIKTDQPKSDWPDLIPNFADPG